MQEIHTKIQGSENLEITLDIKFKESSSPKPIVIFCHGFKGFKDWGAWNLVADEFEKNDFIYLKFNFSHNGTTADNLLDFDNLKAFSENNYSKELDDLGKIIDYVESKEFPVDKNEVDLDNIHLIGHSRGGGAVLVKSFEDSRIQKTTTWASIDSYDRFGSKQQIEQWKTDGQHIFMNGRTGQEMPIKYQFYEDYIENINRLDIKKAVSENKKPLLVVHGTEDPAVHFECAENIASWAQNSKLMSIENANHVFGANHPYSEKVLPKDLALAVKETISFFKK